MKDDTTPRLPPHLSREIPPVEDSPPSPRYVKRQLLGVGGMAKVWRGVRILADRSQQDVAIKQMRGDVRRHPNGIRRFCREARICMDVVHQNIVRVYDFVRNGPHYEIIMEYVDGVTLETLVESGVQLPAKVQRYIHSQIVSSLDALHQRRIIHRDLSPVNVMISRDGMVKLIDLGIAKDLAGPATYGGCKGTLAFASPEVLRGEPVDESCDVYSAAALLFYSLTGSPPAAGETPAEILAKHEAGELAPFPALLPEDLRLILDDLLKPRAERTFQQATETTYHLFVQGYGDADYVASREEMAMLVQSVMDDHESDGKEAPRVTEEFSRDFLEKNLAEGPDDDINDDEIDTEALKEVLEFCFSDRAPLDIRAAALSAAMAGVSLDEPDYPAEPDDGINNETPGDSAGAHQDDLLALLECLPAEDDDRSVDDARLALAEPDDGATAELQRDVEPPPGGNNGEGRPYSGPGGVKEWRWGTRAAAVAALLLCAAISTLIYSMDGTHSGNPSLSAISDSVDSMYQDARGARK